MLWWRTTGIECRLVATTSIVILPRNNSQHTICCTAGTKNPPKGRIAGEIGGPVVGDRSWTTSERLSSERTLTKSQERPPAINYNKLS